MGDEASRTGTGTDTGTQSGTWHAGTGSEVDWTRVIGLGVAGNFTGHLEQAGEASDFKDLVIADANAPKGVFPFYVPLPLNSPAAGALTPPTPPAPRTPDGAAARPNEHFLHHFPISHDRVRLGSRDEKHQIEPEVALLCDLEYQDGRVVRIVPRRAMAHNDCSIRREGARKISEKKNWGPNSKGTARQSIPIDRFEPGGVLDGYRLASFLLRDGILSPYGVDSAVPSYSYMYGQLLEWLVTKLNDQVDEGPLENIAEWLDQAARPAQALISIGATRYTDFGETTFLEPGDICLVALYDAARFDAAQLERILRGELPVPSEGLSLLRQTVV